MKTHIAVLLPKHIYYLDNCVSVCLSVVLERKNFFWLMYGPQALISMFPKFADVKLHTVVVVVYMLPIPSDAFCTHR